MSYDSPIQSGGAAVSLGNYGGSLTGRRDLVTINIRLVRVRDGVVMKSINASRPIITALANGNATRVLGRSILDAQASVGLQEATQTAVREAIEAGVYELVREGCSIGIWHLRSVSPYGPDVAHTGSIVSPTSKQASPAGSQPDPAPVSRKPASIVSSAAQRS